VGGGQLTLGEGRYRLSFSAGPDANAQPQHIVASGNAFVRAPLQTEDVVWASLGWDRSVSRAIGAGLTYAVFTPENDVSQQGESAWIPFAKAGVETTGPGYRIWAWPLNATRRKSGHGAPDARNLSPEQALGLLLGTGTGRYAAVDLGWLERATEIPSAAPDFVMLDLPTEPTLDWKPWWDALEAGMVLQPAGPWNGLFLPDAYGEAEVERALLEGHSFASNGPRLRVVPSFPGGPKTLEVSGITSGTGQWIGSGGEVLHEWTLPSTAPPLQLRRREWAVAVVWNSTLWAASAPQYAQ